MHKKKRQRMIQIFAIMAIVAMILGSFASALLWFVS
jgi:cytochrome c-type biogenesis protein CcmE